VDYSVSAIHKTSEAKSSKATGSKLAPQGKVKQKPTISVQPTEAETALEPANSQMLLHRVALGRPLAVEDTFEKMSDMNDKLLILLNS